MTGCLIGVETLKAELQKNLIHFIIRIFRNQLIMQSFGWRMLLK
jgi:hypothetical protein